jgi:hypothetical protein
MALVGLQAKDGRQRRLGLGRGLLQNLLGGALLESILGFIYRKELDLEMLGLLRQGAPADHTCN